MPRGPRHILPGVIQAIVIRTAQSRFLLRPEPEVNRLIIGALAMAQKRYPEVKVFAVAVPSNHMHLQIVAPTAKHISRFMEYANGNIAREVGRKHQWRSASFWSAPYSNANILDDEAVLQQFRYVLAQTCKEGLVDDPRHWPGVHVAQPLCAGEFDMEGIWVDRSGLYEARRRGEDVTEADFTHEVTLELSKIPQWEHLSDEEYAARVNELVEGICDDAREEHKTFLGAKRVLRENPHSTPQDTKRSQRAVCHATFLETWRWYLFIRNLFRAEYRRAASNPTDRSRSVSRELLSPRRTLRRCLGQVCLPANRCNSISH